MSVSIRLKHSSTAGKVPQPADLADGELAVNTNDTDPAVYLKDSAGTVRRVDGVGGVAKAGDTMTGALNVPAGASGTEVPQVQEVVQKAGDTMTGDLTVPSLNGGPLAGSRNLLINGDFRVWQRGTPVDIGDAAEDLFGPDRWQFRGIALSGGTTRLAKRTADGVPYAEIFNNGHTSTSFIQQKIEDVATLAGQSVSVTLEMDTTVDTSVTLSFIQNFGTGGSSTVTTTYTNQPVTAAGGKQTLKWENVAIPAITGKSIGLDNYLSCYFSITGSGTKVMNIYKAQLEPGPVATPFEQRPIGTELALCERYYIVRRFRAVSTSQTFTYPTTMRTTPTCTADGGVSLGTVLSGSLTFSYTSNVNFNVTADAEL